jgi:hypothetical protein
MGVGCVVDLSQCSPLHVGGASLHSHTLLDTMEESMTSVVEKVEWVPKPVWTERANLLCPESNVNFCVCPAPSLDTIMGVT